MAALEFAIIAPVLLFIVFAAIAYGFLFFTFVSVHQLASDVTRATIGGITQAEKRQLAEIQLTRAEEDYMILDGERAALNVAFDAGTQVTEVSLSYDTSDHPVRIFEGFLPMPPKQIVVRQVIGEHRE